ncbi:MAG: hypothetical protein EB120_11455 [Proteobacteria bacterium]|nr:hypothetical protein [Pseudomonadota bacterium]NDG27776.1 hypothetical protein [Pseudomonadota bacterium]
MKIKKTVEIKEKPQSSDWERPVEITSLSLLAHTASFQTDSFNQPFQTLGSLFLLSIPLTQLAERAWIHGEIGVGLTYSKITLTQPSTSFSHLEFPIPASLRLLVSFSPVVFGEAFVGALYRPFFYDSRDSADGGFQTFQENKFKPEFGLGLGIALSPTLRIRTRGSFFFWSAGVELLL